MKLVGNRVRESYREEVRQVKHLKVIKNVVHKRPQSVPYNNLIAKIRADLTRKPIAVKSRLIRGKPK